MSSVFINPELALLLPDASTDNKLPGKVPMLATAINESLVAIGEPPIWEHGAKREPGERAFELLTAQQSESLMDVQTAQETLRRMAPRLAQGSVGMLLEELGDKKAERDLKEKEAADGARSRKTRKAV